MCCDACHREVVHVHCTGCRCTCQLERELQETKRQLEEARQTLQAYWSGNPDEILKRIQILGFPALDVADIYRATQEWQAKGGNPNFLELHREVWELRALVGSG